MVENAVTVLSFVQFVQNITNLTQLLLFCGKALNATTQESRTLFNAANICV